MPDVLAVSVSPGSAVPIMPGPPVAGLLAAWFCESEEGLVGIDTEHIGRRTVSGCVDRDDAHIVGATRCQLPDPPTHHFLSGKRYVNMLRNGRRIPIRRQPPSTGPCS